MVVFYAHEISLAIDKQGVPEQLYHICVATVEDLCVYCLFFDTWTGYASNYSLIPCVSQSDHER